MSGVAVTGWLVAIAPFVALATGLVIRRRTAQHQEQAKRTAAQEKAAEAKEKAAEAARKADLDNFTAINSAVRRREDELERQLTESTRDHNAEIRTLKAEHAAETKELRSRIEALEKQVDILRGLVNERRPS